MRVRFLHSADDGQEPPVGTSPAPAAPPTPAPVVAPDAPAPPADPDAPPLTPAEARQLRNEAQNLRRRLREFETAQETARREAMSEAERLRADHDAATQELGTLRTEVRAYRLRDAIGAAVEAATLPAAGEGQEPQANPLHGISARLAARLIDPAALEYGDDGRPRPASLRRALEALAAEYPEIRPQAAAAPPPAGGVPFVAQRGASGTGAPASPVASIVSEQIQALHAQRAAAPNPLKRS